MQKNVGKKKIKLSVLVLSLIAITACASFPYPWYGMSLSNLGQEEASRIKLLAGRKGDKSLTGLTCLNKKGEEPLCITMKASDYYALYKEYAEIKARLEACGDR